MLIRRGGRWIRPEWEVELSAWSNFQARKKTFYGALAVEMILLLLSLVLHSWSHSQAMGFASTTKHHLKYRWWHPYHWLRNTDRDNDYYCEDRVGFKKVEF